MTRTALCAAMLCASLAACSTGNPTIPATGSVSTTLPSGGVYKGTLKGSSADVTLLTLFDGSAYLFYGGPGSTGLAGVAVAANGAQTSDGRFSSNAALDYRVGTAPAVPVVFMTNFAQAPAVSGAIVDKDGSPNLAYTASAAPMLDAKAGPTRAEGLYNGRGMSLGGATDARITIALDGYAAGTMSSGCMFQGNISPRTGVNAYDVSLTFGPAPCTQPGATMKGNAVLDGARLMMALPNKDRSNVFLFDGRK
jgi:hypothetical protein